MQSCSGRKDLDDEAQACGHDEGSRLVHRGCKRRFRFIYAVQLNPKSRSRCLRVVLRKLTACHKRQIVPRLLKKLSVLAHCARPSAVLDNDQRVLVRRWIVSHEIHDRRVLQSGRHVLLVWSRALRANASPAGALQSARLTLEHLDSRQRERLWKRADFRSVLPGAFEDRAQLRLRKPRQHVSRACFVIATQRFLKLLARRFNTHRRRIPPISGQETSRESLTTPVRRVTFFTPSPAARASQHTAHTLELSRATPDLTGRSHVPHRQHSQRLRRDARRLERSLMALTTRDRTVRVVSDRTNVQRLDGRIAELIAFRRGGECRYRGLIRKHCRETCKPTSNGLNLYASRSHTLPRKRRCTKTSSSSAVMKE